MVPAQTRSRPVGPAPPRRGAVTPDDDHATHVGAATARRRAVTLLALSLLLPGAAQLIAGNRSVGRIVLRLWFALLAAGLLLGAVAVVSLSTALGLLSAPWFLTIAQWALYGWAVVWGVVLVDAWRLGRPRTQPVPTRRRFAIATVVLLIVPGTVAYAGASVSAGRDALSSVFADGPSVPASKGRYNVLLIGSDSGAGREGMRPDSLQLVSIHAATGRAVTFGFTRDTENIHFEPGSVMAGLMPEGWACGDECLLNGLYTWGWDNQDRFPPGTADPGIVATREAVEALSGLDIQYYAMVDLNGFRTLIDALGGLEITVMRRTPIGGGSSTVFDWIEPGPQRLDGYHALWYARSREGSSNYERMARQRCVMAAMVAQVDPRTLALRFGDIAAASTGVLRTDIPQSDLGVFAEMGLKTRSQKITGVNFVPPLIKPWDYDRAEMRRMVADAVRTSEKTPKEEAVSTSAQPLPGVETLDSPGGSEGTGAAAGTSDSPDIPLVDPLARPSEDANAQTDDIASVCSVG
jgi:polyisoprenyl-teichoic acid--peptidoglycan teichoic acid transferase